MTEDLVALRRDLHQHPELAFEEFRTSGIVAEHLQKLDLEVRTGVAKTGVVANIDGGQPGPTLLLRADMDALPITEETQAPYASLTKGKMHACGHDGHTAILLTAARYLAAHRDHLRGRVRLVFQPAEEGPGGAAPMISEGVLDGVSAAVGLHLWTNLPVGTATVCAGPMMAAADEFKITVRGDGAHAAQPHQGIDPILVGSHIVAAVQSLVSRNVDPLDSAVVSVTNFHAGDAYNVIPPSALLRGTVRTFRESVRQHLKKRLRELAEGQAASFGARVDYSYREGYPPLVNDPDITRLVEGACREVLALPPHLPDARTLGGEDMAYYLREVPGCFFFLGAANPEKNAHFGHHHPRFDIDEQALPVGVELLVRIAESYLGKVG